MKIKRRVLGAALGLAVIIAAVIMARQVDSGRVQQAEVQAQEVWSLELPPELRARLYEMVIVPDEPLVIATSPEAIWAIDGTGEFEPLILLEAEGPEGESATLSQDGTHAGILLHRLHDVVGFRLVDLSGRVLADVESRLPFHYRIAPRGDTFVGISAGGEHVPAKAERFVYTFFDESGQTNAEVVSDGPQPMDSAYSSDGGAFVVSNQGGLFAYQIANGDLRWTVPKRVRLFAVADAPTETVAVSDADERNAVEVYRAGERLRRLALEGNVRNLAISSDGRFILATDGTIAQLLTLEDESPRWSFSMPDKDLTINSAAVNDRGLVALGAQHSELNGGLAVILDADGKIMFETELAYELSNAWIPGVQFDLKGTFVLIRTLEELILVSTE